MTPVELTYDLRELTAACKRYGELSGKMEADVIDKQGQKLARFIRDGLRTLMPEKGGVRAEMLASLKLGGGIHVREAAYRSVQNMRGISQQAGGDRNFRFGQNQRGSVGRGGKRLNYQALAVKAELGLRESGRGFMAWSAPRYRSYAEEQSIGIQHDRYGRLLSYLQLDLRYDAPVKFAKFSWPSDSPALEGLDKDQQMAVIDGAIRMTTADIMTYIRDKEQQIELDSRI